MTQTNDQLRDLRQKYPQLTDEDFAALTAATQSLTDAIVGLAAPAAAQAQDADRYRWLRRLEEVREHDDWSVYDGQGNALRGQDLDAAIDAARFAEPELSGNLGAAPVNRPGNRGGCLVKVTR